MRHVLCLFLKQRLTQTLQATEGANAAAVRRIPCCWRGLFRRVAELLKDPAAAAAPNYELTIRALALLRGRAGAGRSAERPASCPPEGARPGRGVFIFLRARCAGIFTEYLVASQEQAVVQDGLRVVLHHLEVAALTSFLGQRCWHGHPIISHPSCLQHAPVPEPRYPI